MAVTLKIEMAPAKDKKVTSRPVDIVDSVKGTKKTIDMIDPDTTFDVDPGDYGMATPAGDVGEKGTGPPGDSFSWHVPVEPPKEAPEPEADAIEGLPEKPEIVGIHTVKKPDKEKGKAKTAAAASHTAASHPHK